MSSHKESEGGTPSTIMVTKLVRLRSSNDTKSGLGAYTNVDCVGKTKDTISIPAHHENALYQENYERWPSSSPTRLLFRFLGVNPDSGETCHDFGHYNRVTCVDFTRRFNSVPVIFQITEQLTNVKTVNISLNSSNIVLTPEELILLRKPKKSYLSYTVRHLIISIAKWKDQSVISSMPYDKLRLDVILEYAKLSWENIESIKVMLGERQSSTKCNKILKSFRENLIAKFPNINISFAPFTKNHLRTSSGKKPNKKIPQDSITTNCHASPASNQSPNGSAAIRRSSFSNKSPLSLSPQEEIMVNPSTIKPSFISLYTPDDNEDLDLEVVKEIDSSSPEFAPDLTYLSQDLSTNDVQRPNPWKNHPYSESGNEAHSMQIRSPRSNCPGIGEGGACGGAGVLEFWTDGYKIYSKDSKE